MSKINLIKIKMEQLQNTSGGNTGTGHGSIFEGFFVKQKLLPRLFIVERFVVNIISNKLLY